MRLWTIATGLLQTWRADICLVCICMLSGPRLRRCCKDPRYSLPTSNTAACVQESTVRQACAMLSTALTHVGLAQQVQLMRSRGLR